ncbi:MAG: hypothetical protein JXR76_31370 [Deltaproteobacteria bacterium]|nr:hypothetical protein [Deltaproteobacteria bacterium]
MRTQLTLLSATAILLTSILQSGYAIALKATGYLNATCDSTIGPLPEGYTFDNEANMEGRLKLKLKIQKHIRGVFALDASAYDREVIPSRLYVDYKPNKTWRLRIGYSKKIIGLDYERNKDERLTIHRAQIYQKMSRSGLVGRQLAVNVRWRPDKNKANTFSLAFSHDGSHNTNFTWSAIHAISGINGLHAGLWGIFEMRSFKTVGRLNMFANALAMWYGHKSSRLALEIIHGIDPDGSHFEMLFRNSRKVHFLSPRVEAAYRYRLTGRVSLQPLFHSSLIFDDLHHLRSNSLQFLLGLRLQIQKIFLSVNAETIGVSSPKSIDERRYEQKCIYAELVYFF